MVEMPEEYSLKLPAVSGWKLPESRQRSSTSSSCAPSPRMVTRDIFSMDIDFTTFLVRLL